MLKTKGSVSSLIGINNNTDYNRQPSLLYSAEKGDLEKVKSFISDGSEIDQTDNVGKTALILAATNGHYEVVRYLCQQGADVEHRDYGIFSALQYAEKKDTDKHRKVVEILKNFISIHQKAS